MNYAKWTYTETEHVRVAHKLGIPVQEIADKLGRSTGAIESRIKLLTFKHEVKR